MNSLAVRVSSIKNGENLKKNSEIRVSLLELPPTQTFRIDETAGRDAAKAFLAKFQAEYSSANAVEQQLHAVKTFTDEFPPNETLPLTLEEFCDALADIYFYAPLKHPVRNAVAKILHRAAIDERRDVVIQAIHRTIGTANGTIDEAKMPIGPMNDFVASLIGCFENFPEAMAAVELCFAELLRTLNRIIERYLGILQESVGHLSPGKRTEIYIFLHNAIRVVISGVQQFQGQIDDRNALDPIVEQCWRVMIDSAEFSDLPMDSKVNCGLLKVCYDRIFNDIYAPRENLFTNLHSNDPSNAESPMRTTKELCYAVAVINTITETDFDDGNFCVALNCVVDRLAEIGRENTMDSSIIMAVTRALVQISKKLLILLRKVVASRALCAQEEVALANVASTCLKYVWLNVDHSIDSVRYSVKDLLKNLLRLGKQQEQPFGVIVVEALALAKSGDTHEELVCLLLDYLCQVLSTQRVLTEVAHIQHRILANIFRDSCWAACYDRLMLNNATEVDLAEWCARWIEPLLSVNESEWHNNFDRLKIIRNLFERALRTRPDAAEYILGRRNISLEIYLFVLWTMRRSGRKSYAPGNWKPSSDAKVVYAKIHPSDEMRILAFRILIECHKTSELFPLSDLTEILEFFRFNCNCQNPSMRQQINTTMKRALARIECGYVALTRAQTGESEKVCADYRQFLRELIDFCVEWCLFDGANFSRRTIGLTTLLHAIETWKKLLPDDASVFTERLYNRLQRTLADSYVSNRELANGVLRLCVDAYRNVAVTPILNLDSLRAHVASFRPDDSKTAAYFLEYCAFSGIYFDGHRTEESAGTTPTFGIYHNVVVWCERILDDGLAMADASLLQAARYNPLYGALLCIRHILLQIEFKKVADAERDVWRQFFHRIVPKCKRLTDVVAPIVNSSAPEGHLPNDLNDISSYMDGEVDAASQINVTPQIMLVCAWRTVREASLLLGDIALRTPIIPSQCDASTKGLITIDELLAIGAHFQQLLAETKHRGAFEQAFVGFSKLCVRLWRSNEPQMHLCPMKWIGKLASIISGEVPIEENSAELDVTKLCSTRRSAGIPFMVQALVASEVQVCSTTALTYCMTNFLAIARSGPRSESRTHSLNILRALFRCTELGEAVSEYVSDGIECSIRGYSAPAWPERNSSTLLFATLMTRIFGVQRTKQSDNLNIKNKMTGRIFFIRYPRLYDFFLSELVMASDAIKRDERPSRLHPLLLLISRLYPSALEGCESNLKLSTFVPIISICSSCPELVTRQLSAKSMVALIASSNIPDRMLSILVELKGSITANATHGFLLQIAYLLRAMKLHPQRIDNETLVKFIGAFLEIDLDYNSLTAKVYMDILLDILLTFRLDCTVDTLRHRLIAVRNRFVENIIGDGSAFNQLTQSYVQKSVTIFNLFVSTTLPTVDDNNHALVKLPVKRTHHELLETQLNVWHLILLKRSGLEVNSNEYARIELDFAEFVCRDGVRCAAVFALLPSIDQLYFVIANRQSSFHPFATVKAFHILSILLFAPNAFESLTGLRRTTIDELLSLMRDASSDIEIDDVANAIWRFINGHLASDYMNLGAGDGDVMKQILTHVGHITQSYKSNELRFTATETMKIIHRYFWRLPEDVTLVMDFAELLLVLLRDDCVLVRNEASDIVLSLTNPNRADKDVVQKVIPLVAEDRLLEWLSGVFTNSKGPSTWQLWLDLIMRSNSDECEADDIDLNENEASTECSNDIFEPNEINMFGETMYISYKCYQHMMQSIAASGKSAGEIASLQEHICSKLPMLRDF